MSDQKAYCCETMARWSQPCDGVIHHTAIADVPGIRLSDGDSSCVVISFCPWCGKQVFGNGLGGKRMWLMEREYG